MKTKYICFTAPGVAELLEKEIRDPGTGEVLVRVEVSTVSSGTERALVSGEVNVSPTSSLKEAVFPRQSGYSTSGVVISVGEGVTHVKAGDRVALCWSTHSRYLLINKANVLKIEDEISFEEASLFHISAFPLAAIRKCRLEVGESAIVMGLGLLGLIAIKLLRAAGAVPIIAVDPVPEKRALAIKYGADYALDPFDPDFAAKAKEITRGGARVGIEVTGIGAGLNGILDCMAPMGRVALLGCTRHSDFNVDYYKKVHGPGISLIGAHTIARPRQESSQGLWTVIDDMRAVHDLTRCGRLTLLDMIEETHSPSEATEIYKRLVNEKFFPIIQFKWED